MSLFSEIEAKALDLVPLEREEALSLVEAPLEDLLEVACRVRRRFFGRSVRLCSIVNAKSGACPEDCAFCAQSARAKTGAPVYPLIPVEQILAAARSAKANRAFCFSIVTSGARPTARDLERICEAIAGVRALGLEPCASLGLLGRREAAALAEAGLVTLHHNLETSSRFFPFVCTTHGRAERLATVAHAREAGLDVCCGGIFGMGESWKDRVLFALELRRLGVRRIPLNFLHPIPGTPLGSCPALPPEECLRIVALFRIVSPEADIKVCGGRELCLKELQPLALTAGATGFIIGNYLTTPGRPPEEDLRMVETLGMEVECPESLS